MYGGTPHGADDGVGCGSLVGIQKPRLVADLEQIGHPIPTVVYVWRLPGVRGWPGWISGVVVSSATDVVIRWSARKARPLTGILASPGEVVRVASFAARVTGYRVGLFAAPLPSALLRQTRKGSALALPSSITGTNPRGRVVACWSDDQGPSGYTPLSFCKP